MFKIKDIGESLRRVKADHYLFLILATLLAFAVRFSLLHFESDDYRHFISAWYNTIQSMGIKALAGDISNYNPPYLYVLFLIVKFLPWVSKIIAVKIPSLTADFICACFIYKLVEYKSRNKDRALLAYLAVLLSPTVILNSAFWGQADSIYTAGLAACLYFILKKRNWLAFISFSAAFAFKLQAVFLLPFLLIVWLKKEAAWKHFLVMPVIYLASILPAWFIGRPLVKLLTIYFTQANTYKWLTLQAPTLYAWFPLGRSMYDILLPAGIAFSAAVTLAFVFAIHRNKTQLNTAHFMELAMFSVLIVPFTLPAMHERYFFPADVLSIAFGFFFPKYFFIPLAVNLISFFSYQNALFSEKQIPLPCLALAMALVIIIVGRKMCSDLFGLSLKTHEPAE